MGCSGSSDDRRDCPVSSNAVSFHEKYELGIKLGKGSFAQVRVVIDVNADHTSRPKAVKIVDVKEQRPESKAKRKAAHKEVAVWKHLGHHDRIIRLYEVFVNQELCYMIMERCSSSLFGYLQQLPKLNERSLGQLFQQMLYGIRHVHSQNVVHRDIKPENFLVGEDGFTIKLGDFGLSEVLPQIGGLTGVVGTAPFMSPEMLENKLYDTQADMWAYGVLVYALLFGAFPYTPSTAGSSEMKAAILEGTSPSFKPAKGFRGPRSSAATNYAKQLLKRDPVERMSAAAACDATYMQDISRNCHMLNDTLPSLKSMVSACRKAGVFGCPARDETGREKAIDAMLNELQFKMHGKPLPPQDSVKRGSSTMEPCKDQDGVPKADKSCNMDTSHAKDLPRTKPVLVRLPSKDSSWSNCSTIAMSDCDTSRTASKHSGSVDVDVEGNSLLLTQISSSGDPSLVT